MRKPPGLPPSSIPDRIIFDKLLQVLVLGAAYDKIADAICSATTIGTRRDEWIAHAIFTQLALNAYDQIVGLDLEHLAVDGAWSKHPAAVKSRADPPWTETNWARNGP